MIINIRGYSGSGKSTCVKKIIESYSTQSILISRKKRALVTKLTHTDYNDCIVIGPYDNKNQTNGCDVIAYNNQVKLLIEYYDKLNYDVLFEGMMLSTNHTLITDLANRDIKVLYLDVDDETIKQQRKQRAIDNNRDYNYKHDISVMNNDKTIKKSLEVIYQTIGDDLILISPNDIVKKYFSLIGAQSVRDIILDSDDDRFDLMCRYDTMSSSKNEKKTFNDLFYVD